MSVCMSVEDVDECKAYAISCPGQKRCINTVGSFYCGCMRGYIEQDENRCVRT